MSINLRFVGVVLLILIGSGIVSYLVKFVTHIHTPYLAAVLFSISIGFAKPKTGWKWAITQCILITIGYYFIFGVSSQDDAQRELEIFALVGSLLLTFVGSFIGAYIKRAIDL